MTPDRPDGAKLLELARRVLRDLAPLLPPARQGDAPLVARAMMIAERQLSCGPASLAIGYAALQAHCGDGDGEALMHRLAAEIRSGRHDAPGPLREQTRRLLWTITIQKLRESNPDYLAASGIL